MRKRQKRSKYRFPECEVAGAMMTVDILQFAEIHHSLTVDALISKCTGTCVVVCHTRQWIWTAGYRNQLHGMDCWVLVFTTTETRRERHTPWMWPLLWSILWWDAVRRKCDVNSTDTGNNHTTLMMKKLMRLWWTSDTKHQLLSYNSLKTSLQVAPLRHMFLEQFLTFSSAQVVPTYSSKHKHSNLPMWSVQVPPFWQGSDAHSLMSSWQLQGKEVQS